MIRKVSEIMVKNYITVNALWGIQYIQDIVCKSDMACFPVMEDNRILGILTMKDLVKTHPNRIAIDAMSGNFAYISERESIWKAKEILDKKSIDMLLVKQNNEVVGVLTDQILNYELGKHVDLLTGLHKPDYIYYMAGKLLNSGNEISIVFFDVNDFGYINKEFGHAVGDRILQEFAASLKANTPEETYLCRFGGDEFILLTPYNALDCESFVEKLLQAIRSHKFPQNVPFDVAAGIAGGRRRSTRKLDLFETLSNLINIASLASTRAKKEKGNLIVECCGFIDEVAI